MMGNNTFHRANERAKFMPSQAREEALPPMSLHICQLIHELRISF